MPGMDGIETIREIRKWEAEVSEENRLPIIALTANAVSGVREMFLANGFNDYLSKPIPTQELDNIIKKWLSTEKIIPSTKPVDKTHDSFLANVGKTGEINTEIGLEQLSGDVEGYRNTLELFNKKIKPECNGMTSLLNVKDLKRFNISIHAMKSMLAIIGAATLSKEAYEMEMASKNGEIDFCAQKFPQFKERLFSLHENLSVIFPKAEEKVQPAAKKPKTARVLVVDDMDMILFVIKDQLLRYGLEADTASSGHDAVEKAKNNVYDLVFMDHLMPEMDGIEAAAEIRKLKKEYEGLPIIMLTSNMDSGAEEKFMSSGFNGFLSKPVVKQKLEEILKKWLPQAVQL